MTFRAVRGLAAGTAALVAFWCGAVCAAESSAAEPKAAISLEIKDLTPKFLEFYEAAQKEQASPDRRWQLWKEIYDFAAVPPTDEGDKIARRMLDKAWPRYTPVLEALRGGAATLTPDPQPIVNSIADRLRAENPAKVTLRVFVGGFDNNAFTVLGKNGVVTNLPIEMDPEPARGSWHTS